MRGHLVIPENDILYINEPPMCIHLYIKRPLYFFELCRKGGVIKICWRQVETLQLQSFYKCDKCVTNVTF